MYYQERLINGVLMYKGTPNGDWKQCSIEKMSERIIELESELRDARRIIHADMDI